MPYAVEGRGAQVEQLAAIVGDVIGRDEKDPATLEALLKRTEALVYALETDTRDLHRQLDSALDRDLPDVPRLTREIRLRYTEAGRLRPVANELRLHCGRLGLGRVR